jgi:hypothetical protein
MFWAWSMFWDWSMIEEFLGWSTAGQVYDVAESVS